MIKIFLSLEPRLESYLRPKHGQIKDKWGIVTQKKYRGKYIYFTKNKEETVVNCYRKQGDIYALMDIF